MSRHLNHILTAIALLSCSFGFAEILLDDVMDKNLQKKAGIEDLSPKQKRVLETWLNDTFVLKSETEKALPVSSLTLSININNGKQLRLSDDTLWDIDPSDYSITATWVTPFPVQMGDSGNPNYPTLLTNLNTKISVRAKPAESIAPAPQPQETPSPTLPKQTPPASSEPQKTTPLPPPKVVAPAATQP
ncbi:MAG: hypothetical protein K2P51_00475 [Rhabdochlamydiaceae bacterium]|nr:hypothetical protein [Rhabdochlamydiaceae bacterium]